MKKEFKFAFIQTVPVLLGYLFIGIAFGLLLQKAGLSAYWAFFISLIVYAGSMQYVLVSIISSGIGLASTMLMTLTINSRHIFYGLSFIEQFKKMGKLRPYMIFSLTDETYSLLCSVVIPADLCTNTVYFLISLLNHIYWVLGSVLGAVLGQLITFNTAGIEFAMTALFVVIFIEQWLSTSNHLASIVGIFCGVISLIVFGADGFILPALVGAVAILILTRKIVAKKACPDNRDEQNAE